MRHHTRCRVFPGPGKRWIKSGRHLPCDADEPSQVIPGFPPAGKTVDCVWKLLRGPVDTAHVGQVKCHVWSRGSPGTANVDVRKQLLGPVARQVLLSGLRAALSAIGALVVMCFVCSPQLPPDYGRCPVRACVPLRIDIRPFRR